MKSRFVAVSFAATAIAAGSLAGAAAAAESATSTTTQSKPAEPTSSVAQSKATAESSAAATKTSEPAPKPSVVAPKPAENVPTTTISLGEKASESAPATKPEDPKITSTSTVTLTPTPTYTAPEWLQPSSHEEKALEVIAKITLWVTAITAAVSSLMVIAGSIPGLKENIRQITGAFK